MTLKDVDILDNFETWLEAYDAITDLLDEIFGTTVSSGAYVPNSVSILASLRDKIEASLNINTAGIFADPATDHAYVGQFFDENATFSSVANGQVVYMHSGGTYQKAQSGITDKVVGIADVTNGKVIASGFVAVAHGFAVGTRLYLSNTAGSITDTNSNIHIGYAISTTAMILDIGFKKLNEEPKPTLSANLETVGYKVIATAGDLTIESTGANRISMRVNGAERANLDATGNLTANAFIGEGKLLTHTDNWKKITSSQTAVAGERYLMVASADIVLTLPAAPVEGDVITGCDAGEMATTHALTFARNSKLIEGGATNLTIDVDGDTIELVYVDATIGWKRTSQIATLYS